MSDFLDGANGTGVDVEALDIPLDDYVEPTIVRDEQPHTLVVVESPSVKDVTITKTGESKKILEALLRITDVENTKLVKYSVWLPSSTDTKEQQNIAKGRLIKFQKAFGITPEARSLGELVNRLGECVGKEVSATLKVNSSEQYGDSNEVKRLLI